MNRSAGEGNTPLIASAAIPGLQFKLESANPSGSYKDRFVAAQMRVMSDAGARACLATSSGNTGSALAAAAARARLRCVILVNEDAPAGKLLQMRAHGALVVRVPRFVSAPEVTQAVFAILEEAEVSLRAPLVVSAYHYCPDGMRGVETISTELFRAAPHTRHVFVPVGGGGLYSAVVRGFASATPASPLVHAVQPEGCPTLLDAIRHNRGTVEPVTSTTRISGLSVPFDLDASLALTLQRENGGSTIGVTDDDVFAAQDMLFRDEGICAEPAGAAALAGYLRARQSGMVGEGDPCICLVTGHGLKDLASIERVADLSPSPRCQPAELREYLSSVVEGA